MKPKDTIEKAYGSIPKEVIPTLQLDIQVFRGFKYYWLVLVRKFTR